jgi:NADH-quinone oxidoreductase subunit A
VDAGASYAWVAFGEIAVFTAILVAGLAWAWAHGDLDWVKELRSEPRPPRTSAPAAPGGGDRRAA